MKRKVRGRGRSTRGLWLRVWDAPGGRGGRGSLMTDPCIFSMNDPPPQKNKRHPSPVSARGNNSQPLGSTILEPKYFQRSLWVPNSLKKSCLEAFSASFLVPKSFPKKNKILLKQASLQVDAAPFGEGSAAGGDLITIRGAGYRFFSLSVSLSLCLFLCLSLCVSLSVCLSLSLSLSVSLSLSLGLFLSKHPAPHVYREIATSSMAGGNLITISGAGWHLPFRKYRVSMHAYCILTRFRIDREDSSGGRGPRHDLRRRLAPAFLV